MSERETTLTPETRVPIKVAWFLASAAVTGTILLYGIYNRLGTIEAAIRNNWTVDDQRVWAYEMEKRNAAIHLAVPDVSMIKSRSQQQP